MPDRTKRSVVHFSSPFTITGLDGIHPPGDYAIDDDEDVMEGLSWVGYRRVATFIHLPSIASHASTRQMVPIDHAELEAALDRDRAHA